MMKKNTRLTYQNLREATGNIRIVENGEEVTPGFALAGAESGCFLDFSEPVEDNSNYHNTIPEGQDSATWAFDVEKSGHYRLIFRYNNPGFQMAGHRNLRDERNCRVMLDNPKDVLGTAGWLGWMIFNVSGYAQGQAIGSPQTKETIAGNQAWNLNFMNCYLEKGHHTLTLAIQAPPGQAVYDGPNLDWIEIEELDETKLPSVPEIPIDFSFQHPGLTLTMSNLSRLKSSLANRDPRLLDCLNEVKNSPLAQLTYQPHVVKQIDVGPYNQPNIGGEEWTKDCIAAHYHAFLWAVEGKMAHGKKAIEIMNTWSQSLEEIGAGNDLMLRFSLVGIEMICGAEIIVSLYNQDSSVAEEERWSQREQEQFKRFIREKLLAKTAPFYPQANGNWDAIIGSFNMATAVFLEDLQLFKRCLRQYTLGDLQEGPCRSMGAIGNYLYESGESQESSRDQVHARMGLTGLATQAYIAKQQGIDLFSLANQRLLKGFQYNAKYQIGKEVSSATFISDRGRGQADVSSFGYEVILSAYRNSSVDLADIKEAVALTLHQGAQNEAGVAASHWGALLLGNYDQ